MSKFYIKPILLTGGLGDDDDESTITGGNTGLGGGGLGGETRSVFEQVSINQISVESVLTIDDPGPEVAASDASSAVIAEVGEISFEQIP